MRKSLLILALAALTSCGDQAQPKPDGFLALDYPDAQYGRFDRGCPYTFEKNRYSEVKQGRGKNDCWINLEYEKLKGTIFITYQPVKGNLDSLLTDAQKLPLRHTIKADAIEGSRYTNDYNHTYGMFYEVSGDAASQAQFYLTDSINHFLTGSIYFETQPNFDSILPAAEYLKKDIQHLMETVEWKAQKIE